MNQSELESKVLLVSHRLYQILKLRISQVLTQHWNILDVAYPAYGPETVHTSTHHSAPNLQPKQSMLRFRNLLS